jgi:EF hand
LKKVISYSKPLALTVFIVSVISAITASAQTQTTPADVAGMSDAQYSRLYDEMDTNKDGKISRAEYLTYHGITFDRMDSSKSGSLSREDMRSRMFDREMRKTDGNTLGNSPKINTEQRK